MLSSRTELLAHHALPTPGRAAALRLQFATGVNATVRARMLYSLRVFAAIYDYRIAQDDEPADVTIHYGEPPPPDPDHRTTVCVPALYREDLSAPAALQFSQRQYAGENFYFFLGVDAAARNPDWLGEIFVWLSSSHERAIRERDEIGRVPFSHTVFVQQRLSPRRPYAMMVMAWLQNELLSLAGNGRGEALPKPPGLSGNSEHLVISSHDIDFYFTTKSSALTRLLKNLVIAARTYRSWPFFVWNARQILAVLRGAKVGDYFGPLLRASIELGFQSTIFVVADGHHRRDPHYRLRDLASALGPLLASGFSLGLHGSYQSIVEASDLATEVRFVRKTLDESPIGVRQHWLRFADHQKFFATVANAGLVYDSTLGFAEAAGFRNGACFAFPPYDFANERPYPFLEIPLALMDGSVESSARHSGEKPDAVADEILAASRKWGWGGIAADWHNPVEPIQVPDEINQIFWKNVQNQKQNQEKWVSAEQFMRHSLGRYQNAGLLKDVRLDA